MSLWAYAQRSHWTKKQKPVRVQEEHGHVPHLMAEPLFCITPGTALASLWTLSTSSPRPGYIIPPTLLLASGHGLSSAKPSYPPSFPEVAVSWYGMCIPGVLRLNQSSGAASLRSLPASTLLWHEWNALNYLKIDTMSLRHCKRSVSNYFWVLQFLFYLWMLGSGGFSNENLVLLKKSN